MIVTPQSLMTNQYQEVNIFLKNATKSLNIR